MHCACTMLTRSTWLNALYQPKFIPIGIVKINFSTESEYFVIHNLFAKIVDS